MISANERYRRWFNRDFKGLRDKAQTIEQEFARVRNARVLARQRVLHPTKKKNFPILTETEFKQILETLREEWAWAHPLGKTIYTAMAVKEARLCELAAHVTIVTEECMYRVQISATSDYSTQTQPNFYAKSSLTPYDMALQKRGIATHVRYVQRWANPSHYSPLGGVLATSGGDYELWANIPKWMADAIFRNITVDEALEALPPQCNAKVLMPMLDYTRFNKHMAGGYIKKDTPCS